jgi:hypothetical protein
MQASKKISKETPADQQVVFKKVYQKPRLEILGDLRTVTLGPSYGTGESGAPRTRQVNTSKSPFPNLNQDPSQTFPLKE